MPDTIVREKLLMASLLERREVRNVDVRSIRFGPAQKTGLHRHPCPAVGYIVDGSAVFQIEGNPESILSAGSAFYEPAGATILRFDNASAVDQLHFIAFYLLEGIEPLIEMLGG